MGCVYSNHSGSSRKKPNSANGDLNNDTSNEPVRWNANGNGNNHANDNNNNSQSSNRCRIFDVEVCNVDKEGTTVIHGKIEISDNSLIYRLKGRSPIIWPLRFLRSYGHDKDIFSFECGRRCPTGEGVYVFKCSNAEQLFRTLLEAINNATNINSSNIAINNHLSGTISHSTTNTLNAHEYQNLPSLESDHGNFGTLPSRIPQAEVMNRPHSSMGVEQANHTYLNSASHNVIGIKSQPNYYISHPLSGHSSQFDGSKTSLNGSSVGKASTPSNSFDSSTLPPMKGTKNIHHEYVNSNVYINSSLDDSFMNRRKNSEQHLYENHEIPLSNTSRPRKLEQTSSKMAASDDLSTFCYVNLDLDSRKERKAMLQGYKNKSARTTPEPLSYIQLDLNAKSKEASLPKEATKSQVKTPVEISKKETNKNGFIKEKSASKGETSNGKVKTNSAAISTGKENKENNSNQEVAKDKATTTVPYAQIDFAKTLALSNSAANHRKL